MADWRDRGYVPDSDDEEFIEDAFPKDASSGNDAAGWPHGSNGGGAETTTESAAHIISSSTCIGNQPGSKIQETLPDCDMKDVDRDINQPSDFSVSISEKLQAELEQGLRTVREVLSSAAGSDRENRNGLPSSLSSSSLSSLSSLASIEDIDLLGGAAEPSKDEVVEHHENVEPLNSHETRVRSLRQRNPIQLHPYLLENAQYQQQWLSRGLRPVRVEPPQAAAPDVEGAAESQEQDSFRNEHDTEQSALQSSQADESQSPIAQKRHRRINLQDLDADQLPDLGALLEGDTAFVDVDQDAVVGRPSKDNMLKRKRIPTVSRVPKLPPFVQVQQDSPYDVPPSPPGSASIVSNMELGSAGEELMVHGNEAGTRHGLPTPLVSSDRPAKRTYVEISDNEESDSRSPKTSLQPIKIPLNLESMRRRIRGVLPASWIKLDLQQPRKSAPSNDHQMSPEIVDRRGVAYRTQSGNKHRSDDFQAWPDSVSQLVSSQESLQHSPGHMIMEMDYDEMTDSPHGDFFGGEAQEDNDFGAFLVADVDQGAGQYFNTSSHDRRRSIANDWEDHPPEGLSNSSSSDQYSVSRSARNARSHQTASKPKKRVKRKASPVRQTILDAPDFLEHSPPSRARFIRIAARVPRKRTSKEYSHATRRTGQTWTHRDPIISRVFKYNPVVPLSPPVIVPGPAEFFSAATQPLALPTSLSSRPILQPRNATSKTVTKARRRSLAQLQSRHRSLHWSNSSSLSRDEDTSSQAPAAVSFITPLPSAPLFQRFQQSGVLDRNLILPRQADYQALEASRPSKPQRLRDRAVGPYFPNPRPHLAQTPLLGQRTTSDTMGNA